MPASHPVKDTGPPTQTNWGRAARHYFRKWPTEWLVKKRFRLIVRLLALEDVLANRGYASLPWPIRESLRVMLIPEREESHNGPEPS